MKDHKIKIAYVASVFSHLQLFHLPILRDLVQNGCEVHAFGLQDRGMELLAKEGIRCHPLAVRRNPLHPLNARAASYLVRQFKKYGFDLVHSHTPVGGVIGRVASKLAGVPVSVYTAHGFHFYRGAPRLNWIAYYPIEKMLASWTDCLITINREDYDTSLSFPVRKECQWVPGVGVMEEQFACNPNDRGRLRDEWQVAEDTMVFLCVAEMIQRKNHIQLLQAAQQLDAAGKTFCLVFAGTGPEEKAILNYVERNNLTDKVRMLGFRTDVPQLLAASDAAILVSKQEGLPRFVMEAMASGLPVIGTKIRGIQDLIEDGVSGRLVQVGQPGETATAMEYFLDHPVEAKAYGEKGRLNLQPFVYERVKERLISIYSKLLGKELLPNTSER